MTSLTSASSKRSPLSRTTLRLMTGLLLLNAVMPTRIALGDNLKKNSEGIGKYHVTVPAAFHLPVNIEARHEMRTNAFDRYYHSAYGKKYDGSDEKLNFIRDNYLNTSSMINEVTAIKGAPATAHDQYAMIGQDGKQGYLSHAYQELRKGVVAKHGKDIKDNDTTKNMGWWMARQIQLDKTGKKFSEIPQKLQKQSPSTLNPEIIDAIDQSLKRQEGGYDSDTKTNGGIVESADNPGFIAKGATLGTIRKWYGIYRHLGGVDTVATAAAALVQAHFTLQCRISRIKDGIKDAGGNWRKLLDYYDSYLSNKWGDTFKKRIKAVKDDAEAIEKKFGTTNPHEADPKLAYRLAKYQQTDAVLKQSAEAVFTEQKTAEQQAVTADLNTVDQVMLADVLTPVETPTQDIAVAQPTVQQDVLQQDVVQHEEIIADIATPPAPVRTMFGQTQHAILSRRESLKYISAARYRFA